MAPPINCINPIKTSLNKMLVDLQKNKDRIMLKGQVVELVNANFTKGTVIIERDSYTWTNASSGLLEKVTGSTTDLTFKLMEDIVFNPNPPTDNDDAEAVWDAYTVPTADATFYNPAAFGIGFFAAIALSASNVVIDLNGYTIGQGRGHYIFQRFWAAIEVSSLPFIPGQGPHTFGSRIESAENCAIINGNLGLSSHHGIHGHRAKNILIEDLSITQYEVASIHVAEVENFAVNKVRAETCSSCPLHGTFSACLFMRPYVDAMVTAGQTLTINSVSVTASDIRTALRDSIKIVHDDTVVAAGSIQSSNTSEWKLFHNTEGLIDGNPYGIAFNGRGVAVGPWPDNLASSSKNVMVKEFSLKGHKGSVREIPSVGGANDPVGAVFQMYAVDPNGDTVSMDASGVYTRNVLLDSQALVAAGIRDGASFGFLSTTRNGISTDHLNWVAGSITLDALLELKPVIFNNDTMHHVNKGVVGCKFDMVSKGYICNSRFIDISNGGNRGMTPASLPVPWTGTGSDAYGEYIARAATQGGANLPGYNGATARGISLSSSKDICIEGVLLDKINSKNGSAIGISPMFVAQNINIMDTDMRNMTSGIANSFADYNSNPTERPIVVGIDVPCTSRDVVICGENYFSTSSSIGDVFSTRIQNV